MATGPISKQFVTVDKTLGSHAITKLSASGAYYSISEVDVSKTGYKPISCMIYYWSDVHANVTPYIYNDKLGFLSDISQTIGSISVRIVYERTN